MKTIKKEIQAVIKDLKSLTKKTERMAVKVGSLAEKQAETAKTKVNAAAERHTVKPGRIPANRVVFDVINRNRKGINTRTLVDKTGYKEKKVRDIIYRLKKQGKVKSIRTGIYVKI